MGRRWKLSMTMSENAEKLRARLAQLDEDERAVPVSPEYEAIAARLDEEAHTLRELGRYGHRALGEGEDLVDALWDTSDRLSRIAERVDRVANRIDAEESARLLEREGIGP